MPKNCKGTIGANSHSDHGHAQHLLFDRTGGLRSRKRPAGAVLTKNCKSTPRSALDPADLVWHQNLIGSFLDNPQFPRCMSQNSFSKLIGASTSDTTDRLQSVSIVPYHAEDSIPEAPISLRRDNCFGSLQADESWPNCRTRRASCCKLYRLQNITKVATEFHPK